MWNAHVAGSGTFRVAGAATPCTHCRKPAMMLDSIYTAIDGVVHVLIQNADPDILRQYADMLRNSPDVDPVATAETLGIHLPKWVSDNWKEYQKPIWKWIATVLATSATLIVKDCLKGEKPQPTPEIRQQYIDNSVNIVFEH